MANPNLSGPGQGNAKIGNTKTFVTRLDLVATLIEDLQETDTLKRRRAIWQLGQQADSRAVRPLVKLMAQADSKEHSLILAALSEIGMNTLKPMQQALSLSLQDPSPEVRKNAIRDLIRIYDLMIQTSQVLAYAAEDSDGEVRETALWALEQLQGLRSLKTLGPSHAMLSAPAPQISPRSPHVSPQIPPPASSQALYGDGFEPFEDLEF
jgi:HEAT repeat protein